MKFSHRVSKGLGEPPAVLLTDLAFNLVIFFVVCASTEPESGRRQDLPSSNQDKSAAAQTVQNVEVVVTRTTVTIDGKPIPLNELAVRLKPLLAGKTRTEDRMVVVKSNKDTTYSRWIRVTTLIEQAGGIVALQVEESRNVVVP